VDDHGASGWTENDNVFSFRRPTWHTLANCRNVSGRIFFEEAVRIIVKEAKAVCNKCPVRERCLDFAIRNEEVGIWGGMTTTERRRHARHRKQHGIR
jgi:WhiB family redox-sensing transcriptional regulator